VRIARSTEPLKPLFLVTTEELGGDATETCCHSYLLGSIDAVIIVYQSIENQSEWFQRCYMWAVRHKGAAEV
jgi:hypothetical protein